MRDRDGISRFLRSLRRSGFLVPGHLTHCLFALICVAIAVAQQPESPSQKQSALWDKLQNSIQEIDHRLDGVMGVAILDLASGHTYFLRGDETFPQASAIKIAILAELYHQVQQDKLKFTDLYTVNQADLVPDSYIMGGLTPGITRITLRDLATMMIAVSDNSATNVLIDRVGMDNVNRFMDSLGLGHTRLRRKMMDLQAASQGRENVSSPREMMGLLESIYLGKVFNQQLTDDFFKALSAHGDAIMPRGLPASVRVASKSGELEGVRNDSGIIFAQGRPFVICVMTTYLRNERDGEDAIQGVALAAYRMFERLGRASDLGRVISPANSSTP